MITFFCYPANLVLFQEQNRYTVKFELFIKIDLM